MYVNKNISYSFVPSVYRYQITQVGVQKKEENVNDFPKKTDHNSS